MTKLLLFISNGSELLEISPFVDVFGWNSIVGDKEKKIKIITASYGNKIKSTWNLELKCEINFNEDKINVDEFDGIIIPGGFGLANYFSDIKKESFQNLIQEFNLKEKLIIGICTGAIALGEAGILRNRKATTYRLDNKRYFNQLSGFEAISVEENFVMDKNIITTSNPNSALIAAFFLLNKFTSKENMEKVAFNMGYMNIVPEINNIINKYYK